MKFVDLHYIFMKLLDGKILSEKILDDVCAKVRKEADHPHLAVFLVGDDPASHLYVSLKEKAAKSVGIDVSLYKFSVEEGQESVLECVKMMSTDEEVDGILVQLPLPEGFDTKKIIGAITPGKDVDGFSSDSGLVPVFPRAISLLIESSGVELKGKNAMIIANSDEFGVTMREMLKNQKMVAEYVLAKNISSNLGKIKDADVVVSAVGSPGLLEGEMFKDGAIVIDGGIEKVDGITVGDVDFASTEEKEGFLSPVPGGVGPVTIACLLENVYLAFKAQQKEKSN